jgi:hypothetical protein
MKAAEADLEQARVRYYGASKNVEKVATATTLTALQDAGREYARIIVEHSCAAMEWLALAEVSVRQALADAETGDSSKDVRKNASGGE